MVKRIWGVLIFLLCVAPLVQAQECAALIQEALDVTTDLCGDVARNQACYGNLAIDAVPQSDVVDFKFDEPGDIEDVSAIQSLNLSALTAPDEWGVALLSLQADLPDTIPGQNVTVLLFGGTAIETAGAPALPTVDVSTDSAMNIRSGPGTGNRALGKLQPGTVLTSDGQNEAGDWLRVLLEDGSTGWVSADLVNIDGDASTLAVVDTTTSATGITYAPMQAFYFSSGVGQAGCAEAPQDGILIQTPQGVGQVNLLINEVSVELGSTAYVRAHPGGMSFNLLEGHSSVTAGGKTVNVLPGTRAIVPLDDEGKASGTPELTTIPDDELIGLEGLVTLLPEEIEIPTPLTAAELEEATHVDGPAAGLWTTTDTNGGSFIACTGTSIPSPDPVVAELVPTDDGFTIMYPTPFTFVGDGAGNYSGVMNSEGLVMTYNFTLIEPDLLRGTVFMDMDEGCNLTWYYDITRN